MKILVTGGSGFLGHNLILALRNAGHEVTCLDRYEAPFLKENQVNFISGDMSEKNLVEQSLDGMDAIIHLACTILPQMSNVDPYFDLMTNVGSTIQMLDACIRRGVKKVVFLSSGGTVYGKLEEIPVKETAATNPTCSYGITKLMIEKYLRLYHQLHGLQTHAVRLANPYGRFQRVKSPQGVIPVFCYRALKDEEIQIWGDGTVQRDFIYVDDAVAAIVKLLGTDDHADLREINIGSGKSVSLNDLLVGIESILGKKIKVVYQEKRDFDVPISVLDISKAEKLLNWKPQYSLTKGLEKTINWIRENEL